MSEPAGLDVICSLLSDKYAERGVQAAERLRAWTSGRVAMAYPEFLAKHLDPVHLSLIFDAFWQVLPFGTGGRRGAVGYGSNRMNPTTVVLTVQGHCDYLKTVSKSRTSVVIANDVRVFNDFRGTYGFLGKQHPLIGMSSRSLAKLACEVYTGNGIECYIAEPESDTAVLTTPELSFLISELGATGGINISASHNPPDDNGVKVYDEFGSQPIAPHDQLLIDTMERVTQIQRLPFSEGLSRKLIHGISETHHRHYVEIYEELFRGIDPPKAKHPIVYTPLSGCGLTTVGRVLPALGFSLLVPPDEYPDGTFKAIPFKTPNPEVPDATNPAKAFAVKNGSGIVLSSDPDADRVGVEIRLPDGSWYHFDGNQIAGILCYFLMRDPKGPQRRGLVIETLVTTKMLGKITSLVGDSWVIDDLLVGFKYVAAALKEIERTGHYRGRACSIKDFVLATEESHGVVVLPGIRDKDATPACMYLAALYLRLKEEGRTLLDYYVQILEDLGEFAEVNRSIVMTGADGVFLRDRLMLSLRTTPPQSMGGRAVLGVVDYWDEQKHGKFVSESDKLPRNVIHYKLDAFTVTIRPSGTEPKAKIYCQLLPQNPPSTARGLELLRTAREQAEVVARAVYHDLLHRIDIDAGPISLLLPDIIDINQKLRFEKDIVPRFIDAAKAGKFTKLNEGFDWLRTEAGNMLPGADPVPALKPALNSLCAQLKKNSSSASLATELEAWARS